MSVFDTAKKLPSTTKESKKTAEKEVINVPGLANYAMVDAVVKGYGALKETFGSLAKNEMVKVAIDLSKKRDNQTAKRPPNFRGTDGDKAEASCEIRVRNWNSVLEPEEVAILERHKIPYNYRVSKEEGYFVNPEHYGLVEKMKGLPADFLLYQAEEKVPVASADSVEAVFAKGLADKLLDIVATLAIKAQYKGTLAEALEEAKQFVVAAEESQKLAEEKEEEEAAKKAAKDKAKREAKKAAKA
jgi:hypothetical protein